MANRTNPTTRSYGYTIKPTRPKRSAEPVGITESGGSRYESGRNIPPPVQLLLVIALATPAKSAKVAEDLRAGCSEKAVS